MQQQIRAFLAAVGAVVAICLGIAAVAGAAERAGTASVLPGATPGGGTAMTAFRGGDRNVGPGLLDDPRVGRTISGTVTEIGSGIPVQVTVIATPSSGASGRRTATSKPDGSYRLTDLDDDGYVIGFSHQLSAIGAIVGYYGGASTIEDAEVVTVAGGDRTGIDASVPPPPLSIGGRVVDADRRPLEGVQVLANGVFGFGAATTGADGRYRIAGMPAGSYTVEYAGDDPRLRTQYFNGALTRQQATAVNVANGVHRTDVDAQLHEQPHVRGTVTDAATGDPMPQARVYLLRPDGLIVGAVDTDEQGRYLMGSAVMVGGVMTTEGGPHTVAFAGPGGVLPPEAGSTATYPGVATKIQVDDYVPQHYDGANRLSNATVVDIPANAGVANVDASLERGGSITGAIERSHTGGSLEGVYVTAYADDDQPMGETRTAADGSYAIRSLAPGDYRVRFASASARDATSDPLGTRYYRSAETRGSGDPVTVVRGRATALEVADLERPAAISGRVLVAGTGAAPIVPLTMAYLYRWEDGFATSVSATPVSTVDGSYRFDGIALGHYSVCFAGAGYASQCVNGTPGGAPDVSGATRFDLRLGGERVGVDAELRGAARIAVRVTSENGGMEISGTSVVLRHAVTGDVLRTVLVASDGAYTLGGLTPGVPVVLEFRPPAGANLLGGFYGGATFATAERVIPGATETVVDYHLEPGASVTGTVVYNDTGAAIRNARARLSGDTGSQSVTVGPNGRFDFVALEAGRYELQLDPPEGVDVPRPRLPIELVLAAGERRDLGDVAITYGGSIQGTVRAAGGTTGIAGVRVEAVGTGVTATTSASGHYFLHPLPAGSHRVRFDPSSASGDFVEQYYQRAAAPDDAQEVQVVERGGPNSIDAALVQAPWEAPKISGRPVVGSSKTPLEARWKATASARSYRWYGCPSVDAEAEACEAIGTGKGIVLREEHVGMFIEVVETATVLGAQAASRSNRLGPVVPVRIPTNEQAPVISGDPVIGGVIAATTGTWMHDPTSFRYRWYRCGGDGTCHLTSQFFPATTAYDLTAGDIGWRMELGIIARNVDGDSVEVRSNRMPVVPLKHVGTLEATGSATEGGELASWGVEWLGDVSVLRQWRRCNAAGADCETIGETSGRWLALQTSDVGHTFRVRETATATGDQTLTETIESAPTPVVTAMTPTVATPPMITGTPREGTTLTADDGTWIPSTGPYSYERRWLRCVDWNPCQPIPGAHGPTYVLSSADVGHQISVEVRATRLGVTSEWTRAIATSPVARIPPVDPPGDDPPKSDPPKNDPPKSDPPKSDPPKSDPPKSDPPSPPGGGTTKLVAARVASLKVLSRGTRLELRFRGGSQVRTTVTVSSRSALPIRGKRQVVRLASVTVTSPRTTTVRLSALARQALRGRRSLPVTVRIAPRGGKAVTQRLTLRVS